MYARVLPRIGPAQCTGEMSRRKTNKFVSSTALTRPEKEEISKLIVQPKYSGHGNYNSVAWEYFGDLSTAVTVNDPELSQLSTSTATLKSQVTVLDFDRHYCRVCLKNEQAKYAKGDSKAHLSKVKHFSRKTSTTALCEHLYSEHGINTKNPVTSFSHSLKQSTLDSQVDTNRLQPATSSYELNRDIALWFALDLEPFETINKSGFNYFFNKNLPSMKLPSDATLRGQALTDIYKMVKEKVIDEMKDAPAICLMFDGWTDTHKARSYLGLRCSYITNDWDLRLVTLSCKPLEAHSAEKIANHVRNELSEFVNKTVKIFTTHDGAANMFKTSKLLRVEAATHCSAHALNLLLMTDGLNQVEEIMTVVEKCKTVTRTLHFKGHMIEEGLAVKMDRNLIDKLMGQITKIHDVTSLDDQIPAFQPEEVRLIICSNPQAYT